jgi:hypothetical protein
LINIASVKYYFHYSSDITFERRLRGVSIVILWII